MKHKRLAAAVLAAAVVLAGCGSKNVNLSIFVEVTAESSISMVLKNVI